MNGKRSTRQALTFLGILPPLAALTLAILMLLGG